MSEEISWKLKLYICKKVSCFLCVKESQPSFFHCVPCVCNTFLYFPIDFSLSYIYFINKMFLNDLKDIKKIRIIRVFSRTTNRSLTF